MYQFRTMKKFYRLRLLFTFVFIDLEGYFSTDVLVKFYRKNKFVMNYLPLKNHIIIGRTLDYSWLEKCDRWRRRWIRFDFWTKPSLITKEGSFKTTIYWKSENSVVQSMKEIFIDLKQILLKYDLYEIRKGKLKF